MRPRLVTQTCCLRKLLIVYANNQSSISIDENRTNRKDCKTPITNFHEVIDNHLCPTLINEILINLIHWNKY